MGGQWLLIGEYHSIVFRQRCRTQFQKCTYFDGYVTIVSLKLRPFNRQCTGADGNGFVSIETLLVRLNTTYTPNGKFLTHSDLAVPDASG
jgi:hypothetical protein